MDIVDEMTREEMQVALSVVRAKSVGSTGELRDRLRRFFCRGRGLNVEWTTEDGVEVNFEVYTIAIKAALTFRYANHHSTEIPDDNSNLSLPTTITGTTMSSSSGFGITGGQGTTVLPPSMTKLTNFTPNLSSEGMSFSSTVEEVCRGFLSVWRQENQHCSFSNFSSAYQLAKDWGLACDAIEAGSAETFVVQIEDLQGIFQLSDIDILRLLPGVLAGPALKWYLCYRPEFPSWADFRQAFLNRFGAPDFQDRIRQLICERKQGWQERACEYLTCLQWHLRYLDPPMPIADQLEIAYGNLLPDYQQHVSQNQCQTIDDLARRCREYEAMLRKNMESDAFNDPSRASLWQQLATGEIRLY